MSLTPGTTLGSYQVTAKIGKGGMGVDYSWGTALSSDGTGSTIATG